MEIKDVVATRSTARAFQSKHVPRNILEEIMVRALRAPSWGNTQPWKFTIISGNTLKKIKEDFVKLTQSGISPNPDIPIPTKWNEIQTFRRKQLGKALFQTLGIERGDNEKRDAYYLEMAMCFGAPHLIYLHLEKGFNPYALLDVGLILQTIALLATDQGLGTCFLARSILYPDVVWKYAGIPPDQILVMGTAVGYPILDHPANILQSQRGTPEEFLMWVDLE